MSRNILVVKLADTGDALTITPALRALRTSLADARITALVTPHAAEALRGLPFLDALVCFDKFQFDQPWQAVTPWAMADAIRLWRRLRAGCYDTIIVLHHLTTRWGAMKYAALVLSAGAPRRIGLDNGRGWFFTQRVVDRGFGARHEVDYWLEVVASVGAHTDDRRLAIALSDEDRTWAARVLSPLGQGTAPIIAIHPGTGRHIPARSWSTKGFAAVANALITAYGAHIILIGGPAEGHLGREVMAGMRVAPLNLVGQTTVHQAAAVLERCHLFIGGDSGVMHLAVAAGTSVVALFGPTNEQAWGPYVPPSLAQKARVVRAPGTAPRLYVGHALGNTRDPTLSASMAAITPDMVLAAAHEILGG